MTSGRIFMYVHVTHNWIACYDVMTSSNLLSDDVWTNSIIHMTPQVRSCHSVPKTSWSKTTSVHIRFRPLSQAMVERQWIITNRTTLTIGVCRQRWLVHPTNNHTFGSSTDTTTHRNERCDLCASDLRCVVWGVVVVSTHSTSTVSLRDPPWCWCRWSVPQKVRRSRPGPHRTAEQCSCTWTTSSTKSLSHPV